MRLEYDPVAEDFLLIEQGRVVERVLIYPSYLWSEDDIPEVGRILDRLRRPARSADPVRTSIDKPTPTPVDEALIKRFKPNGAPLLDLPEIDIELEDLL